VDTGSGGEIGTARQTAGDRLETEEKNIIITQGL
jgi:hypothetical protein